MSKGLKALDEIWGYTEVATLAGYVEQPIKKVYKKEFAVIKDELKALEIIKKKVDERRIVLENNFDNKFSLGGLELCDLTYSELATILECLDLENIKVVDGKIQISLIRS